MIFLRKNKYTNERIYPVIIFLIIIAVLQRYSRERVCAMEKMRCMREERYAGNYPEPGRKCAGNIFLRG